MPDFLSRLVERTFGLMAVVQPVTGSIFASRPPVESDYIPGLAFDHESVTKQDGIHIDNPLRTRSIPQQDDQPALNQKKQLNEDVVKPSDQIEDLDILSDFTSTLKPLHNIESLNEPLKQNNSSSLERIESAPLHRITEPSDEYIHTQPAKLNQANKPPYSKIDFDTLKSLGNEQIYSQKQNDRSVLPQIPKSILIEDQSHAGKKNSLRHVDAFVDSVYSPVSNEDSFVSETLLKSVSDSSQTSGNSSSLKNKELILQNSKQDYSEDFYPPGRPHPDVQSSPKISGNQSLKQVSTPKVNATLEQMDKMLDNMFIKQRAVATRSSSTVPTVKVTIGRIEVRAVNPPQAPQHQTPPPGEKPILSLDDYLKKHNG